MRTILLATDGSAGAELATLEAIELATQTGCPLRIVAVWAVSPLELSAAPMMAGDLAEVALEHARHALEDAVQRAADAGLAAIPYLRHGDAPAQICAVADLLGDTMIVVGSHGRGALGRALLGSVSTKLVQSAPCPVLVVRTAATGAPASTTRRPAVGAV